MRLIVIGRNPKQAEIIIPNEYISNYHAELIQLDNGDMFIVDKSTNGTYLNGFRLTPGKETAVRRGDSVYFTDFKIPLDWSQVPEIRVPAGVRRIISIGSHEANEVVLKGSLVSRFHATIRQMEDGKWYICDHSVNGTTVNGKSLPKGKYVPLKAGDEISCAGIPIENPVPGKKAAWLYAGISIAVVCVAALVVLGLHFIKRSLSDEQLIGMYEHSVGLIVTNYHFEVSCGTLPIGVLPDPDSYNAAKGEYEEPLYDEFVIEGDYIVEYDGTNSMLSTGTGFFVGNSGALVTNRHVARPWEMDKIDYGTSAVTIKKAAEDYFRAKLTALYEEKGLKEALPYISQVEVRGVVDNMVIVPNGKYFNSHNVVSCTEIACSSENEDLAVVKILTDQLPVNVTPVPLHKIVPVEPKKGAHVMTIGFPMGVDILDNLEKTEIQAHTTSGSISRNDNKYVFGFDAVSSPGASGSPVFDKYGNLIGVLNSGYINTQGFNFGVRSEYVVAMLNAAEIVE